MDIPITTPIVRTSDAAPPEAAQKRRSSVVASDIANPIGSGPARRRSSLVPPAPDGVPKPGEAPVQMGRRRSSVASNSDAQHSARRNSLIGPTPSKAITESGPQKSLGQKKLRAAVLAGILGAAANARDKEEEAPGETEEGSRVSGDRMRALVNGRGLTLRGILTFATALKRDNPMEEKRERPMMPKDTEAELDAILDRVSELVLPYHYTYEEMLYRKRPASGHHGPDKPRRGQLRSVLQDPIQKALKFVGEQQMHSYMQQDMLGSAQGWFNTVKEEQVVLENEFTEDEAARQLGERQAEEAEDYFEASQRTAANLRDRLIGHFGHMVRTLVKRTMDRREAKHKYQMERVIANARTEQTASQLTIQDLQVQLKAQKDRGRSLESKLLLAEIKQQTASDKAGRHAREQDQRIALLERLLDAKEEKERVLEAQERQEGLDAYVEQRRKERGDREAFKSSLRGPLRNLMEKNEELRRHAEAKEKEMHQLLASMEQERASVGRVVEAAMQPYKQQLLEAQENAERLTRTLEGYGNVQQTINQLSDRCEDLHMLSEKQASDLQLREALLEEIGKQLKERDKRFDMLSIMSDKRIEELEVALQGRVTEVESYRALLTDSKRETAEARAMLEVTNLRLATLVRDAQTRLNEELSRAAAQHSMHEKEMEMEVARLKSEMADMQAKWQAERATHALVKGDRDRLLAAQESGLDSLNAEGKPLGYRQDSEKAEAEGPSAEEREKADKLLIRKLEHLLHKHKEEAEEKGAEYERQLGELREQGLTVQALLSRAREKLGRHWQGIVEGVDRQRGSLVAQVAASLGLGAEGNNWSDDEGDGRRRSSMIEEGGTEGSSQRRMSAYAAAAEHEKALRELKEALQRGLALNESLQVAKKADETARKRIAELEAEALGLQTQLLDLTTQMALNERDNAILGSELANAREQVQRLMEAGSMSQGELKGSVTRLIDEMRGLKVQWDVARLEARDAAAEAENVRAELAKLAAKKAEEVKALKVSLYLAKVALKEERAMSKALGVKVKRRKIVRRQSFATLPKEDLRAAAGDEEEEETEKADGKDKKADKSRAMIRLQPIPRFRPRGKGKEGGEEEGGGEEDRGVGRPLARLTELRDMAQGAYLEAIEVVQSRASGDPDNSEGPPSNSGRPLSGGDEGEKEKEEEEEEEEKRRRVTEGRLLLEDGQEELQGAFVLLGSLLKAYFNVSPMDLLNVMSPTSELSPMTSPTATAKESEGDWAARMHGLFDRQRKGQASGGEGGRERRRSADEPLEERGGGARQGSFRKLSGPKPPVVPKNLSPLPLPASGRRGSTSTPASAPLPGPPRRAESVEAGRTRVRRTSDASDLRGALAVGPTRDESQALRTQLLKLEGDSRRRLAELRRSLAELTRKWEGCEEERAALQAWKDRTMAQVTATAKAEERERERRRSTKIAAVGLGALPPVAPQTVAPEGEEERGEGEGEEGEQRWQMAQAAQRRRVAGLLEAERSLAVSKRSLRLELLSLGARLLHFRAEHERLTRREERPEDNERPREAAALEHGMASLQAQMERRKVDVTRAEQQRVGLLQQLMGEFHHHHGGAGPKMVMDGLAFASVAGWAQGQLDSINAQGKGTQKPPSLSLQDRRLCAKDGREQEERLRHGVGTLFAQFVPPGEEDGEGSAPAETVDVVIFRSEGYREPLVHDDRRRLKARPSVSQPPTSSAAEERPVMSGGPEEDGEEEEDGPKARLKKRHLRTLSTDLSNIDLRLGEPVLPSVSVPRYEYEGERKASIIARRASAQRDRRTTSDRPGSDRPDSKDRPGTDSESIASTPGMPSLTSLHARIDPPPPLSIRDRSTGQVVAPTTGAARGGAMNSGLITPPPPPRAHRYNVPSAPSTLCSPPAGEPASAALVGVLKAAPENDASQWPEEGAALRPPSTEASYHGMPQSLAHANVSRMNPRSPMFGDRSDGEVQEGAAHEPFIPLGEREPLHVRMFDALHCPDHPLVRIVTDGNAALFFPLLNKRNNNNNNAQGQQGHGRRGQRRGSDGGHGRHGRQPPSHGPRLLVGNGNGRGPPPINSNGPSLLPDVVPPPMQPVPSLLTSSTIHDHADGSAVDAEAAERQRRRMARMAADARIAGHSSINTVEAQGRDRRRASMPLQNAGAASPVRTGGAQLSTVTTTNGHANGQSIQHGGVAQVQAEAGNGARRGGNRPVGEARGPPGRNGG